MSTLGETGGELPAGTLEALSRVTAATLSMQLLKRGIRRCWLEGPRSLHSPGHPAAGRLVGEAFTLRFLPLREDLGTTVLDAGDGQPRSALAHREGERLVRICIREALAVVLRLCVDVVQLQPALKGRHGKELVRRAGLDDS